MNKKNSYTYKSLFFILVILMATILVFVALTFEKDDIKIDLQPIMNYGKGWICDETIINIDKTSPLMIDKEVTLNKILPSALSQNEALIINGRNISIEVFINKKQIFSNYFIENEKHFGNTIGDFWSLVDLDENQSGNEITLSFSPIGISNDSAILEIYLDTQSSFVINFLKTNFLKLSALILILIFCIITLIVAISEFFTKREYSLTDFYMGIFLFNVFLWLYLNMLVTKFIIDNVMFFNMLAVFAFLILPITFLLFLTTVHKKQSKSIKLTIVAYSIYSIVRVLLYIFNILNLSSDDSITDMIIAVIIMFVLLESFINPTIWLSKTIKNATILICILTIAAIACSYLNESLISIFYIGVILFCVLVFLDRLKQTNNLKLQAKEYETYKTLAMNDVVTDTKNRLAFNTDIADVIGKHNIAIVVTDLNNLKTVNDTLGHIAGDTVIASLGLHLKEIVDKIGTVYRMGGDEFAVIMLDCTEENLNTVKALLLTPKYIMVNGERLLLDFSFGVAESDCLECSPQEFYKVFHDADERMYYNKRIRRTNI